MAEPAPPLPVVDAHMYQYGRNTAKEHYVCGMGYAKFFGSIGNNHSFMRGYGDAWSDWFESKDEKVTTEVQEETTVRGGIVEDLRTAADDIEDGAIIESSAMQMNAHALVLKKDELEIRNSISICWGPAETESQGG